MSDGSAPAHKPVFEGSRTLGRLLPRFASDAPPLESEWVALVAAVAAGDRRALRELYERTHWIVYLLGVRLLKEPPLAEHVMLDVYVEVWERAERYEPARESVVGWIMNLTRSLAMNRLRAAEER
jgi:RNA polymerase sigma-70 factor (ECF subfamily)